MSVRLISTGFPFHYSKNTQLSFPDFAVALWAVHRLGGIVTFVMIASSMVL